jgi:acetyltransferase-like isoleucine patch superfamily enzyme
VSVTLPHDWFGEPVPQNCRLGERSWLYSSFAFRHFRSGQPSAVVVGDDTGVYNGTFFDLGADARVSIGRYCSIVGAIFSTNHCISISDYVFISHEVVLADDEIASPPELLRPPLSEPKTNRDIVIESDVWIGARAIILGGSRIGAGAVVGAAAVVNEDIPPYAVFAGNPGRVVGYAQRPRSM